MTLLQFLSSTVMLSAHLPGSRAFSQSKVGSQDVMPKLLHDATKCLLQAGILDLPCWLGCQQAFKKFAELVHVPWHLSLLWLQVFVLVQVECLLLSIPSILIPVVPHKAVAESFKNGKPIGEVTWCDATMAERTH